MIRERVRKKSPFGGKDCDKECDHLVVGDRSKSNLFIMRIIYLLQELVNNPEKDILINTGETFFVTNS